MFYIFLGPDDFTKKERIRELVKSEGLELACFGAGDEVPAPQQLIQQNLFSASKAFLLEGMSGKFDYEKWAPEFIKSSNHVFFVEEKLDKRLNSTKDLLKNKNIKTEEFTVPHGREFEAWIGERVKKYGGSASPEAVSALAQRLGRDESFEVKFGGKVVERKEIYTLWQAENEIKKLLALGEGTFDERMVAETVKQELETDVLAIVNAIGEGRRREALEAIAKFLELDASAGEKEKIIQLNALLSEQFRNVALVQHYLEAQGRDQEILAETGWKSGRLFVMRKIASRFPAAKVMDVLQKLSHLDGELKTGSTPPGVLLDLILVQMLAFPAEQRKV